MTFPLTRVRRRGPVVAALATLLALGAGALSALPAEAAAARTFYIDCNVKSDGNGSVQSPWKSLGHVNRKVGFIAGDQILFKRGSTCSGRAHPLGNGSAAAPIVLGAYGSGAKPTINGEGTADQTGTVQLMNQSHWTVQDLHITNAGKTAETNAYRSGLFVRGSSGRLAGLLVQRLTIDKVSSNLTYKRNDPREFGGITVQTLNDGKPGSGFDGLLILHNRVANVGRTGIVVSNHGYPKTTDRNTRIAFNTITRARGDSIVVRGGLNTKIDHNVSAYGANFWPCNQCGQVTPDTANAAIWPAYSRDTLVEYNEVYGEHKPGGDGEAFDIDISAVHTVVQYNYAHDNEGGGVLFCGSNNAVFRFNILQNNKQGAINFIGSIPATNSKIYNNTIYSRTGNDAKVVRTFAGLRGKGVTFFNNLIYNLDDSGYYVWPTKPRTRTNTYVGVHGIAEPSEIGKGWGDPGLRSPGSGKYGLKSLNGYKPSSPRDDPAGSAVPKTVTHDFFGKKINSKRPPRGAAG